MGGGEKKIAQEQARMEEIKRIVHRELKKYLIN